MVKWLSKQWNTILEDKTAFAFAIGFAITQLSILFSLMYAFMRYYRIDEIEYHAVPLSKFDVVMFPIAFLGIVVVPFFTRWFLAKYVLEPLYNWIKKKQRE